MGAIGMTDRLVTLAPLVGWLRGIHAYVNVVGSMMFGGISARLADISAIGPSRSAHEAGRLQADSRQLTVPRRSGPDHPADIR
jgi:hypothetical protein